MRAAQELLRAKEKAEAARAAAEAKVAAELRPEQSLRPRPRLAKAEAERAAAAEAEARAKAEEARAVPAPQSRDELAAQAAQALLADELSGCNVMSVESGGCVRLREPEGLPEDAAVCRMNQTNCMQAS